MTVNIAVDAIKSAALHCKFKLKFWARHSCHNPHGDTRDFPDISEVNVPAVVYRTKD